MNKVTGVIGCGNMGGAIVECLSPKYKVLVFDKDASKIKDLQHGSVVGSVIDLVNDSDIIILAIKPQDYDGVLDEIRPFCREKLIVSIAAGLTTSYVEKKLGKVRVVRVMPNMPVKIAQGITCLCGGEFADTEDLRCVETLFKNLGQTFLINEDMMDEATAISGSGPGFFYDLLESENINVDSDEELDDFGENFFFPRLKACAQDIGFDSEQAKLLALYTTKGSIALLKATHLPPAQLRGQVASKGGTTERGIKALRESGALDDAIKAAVKRAKELLKAD